MSCVSGFILIFGGVIDIMGFNTRWRVLLRPALILGMVRICFRILFVSFMLTGFAAFPCSAKYGGGAGTAQNPYLIYTAEDLNEIGLGDNSGDWDKHFALMADIDLSGFAFDEFNLIGLNTSNPFSGVFDGRGHIILNFTYDSFDVIVGLFRVVGAEVL